MSHSYIILLRQVLRSLFSFFLFFIPLVHGSEEFLVLNSDLADYDGKKITLSGNTIIDHELGNMAAGQIVLTPHHGQKKLRFAALDMYDRVKIVFRDGGELNCAFAHIDALEGKGKFLGNPQQEYVIYSESRSGKGGQITPIVVKSREMEVYLDGYDSNKENVEDPVSRSISKITAQDNVTVNYNHDIIALADCAVYERGSDTSPGVVLMNANEPTGICSVTNCAGDIIYAAQIRIDPAARILTFLAPKGKIHAPAEKKKTSHIDFSSEEMVWNELNDCLMLQGQIMINQEGIGQIVNNNKVNIYRYGLGRRKYLKRIDSPGETVLKYADKSNGAWHTLTSYGSLCVDHENLQTILESPRGINGEVLEDKQVYFEDRLGEIYADRAVISYDYINHAIVPAKLTLTGNVKILNRTAADEQDRGKFLQYALTDHLEYFPLKNKMHLKGNGHRVLFFDKANNVKVSAPALRILRDPDSKKDSIQGFGDVRFSFIEEELEELRKHFNLPEEG